MINRYKNLLQKKSVGKCVFCDKAQPDLFINRVTVPSLFANNANSINTERDGKKI